MNDYYLEHVGILGMKWGQRGNKNKTSNNIRNKKISEVSNKTLTSGRKIVKGVMITSGILSVAALTATVYMQMNGKNDSKYQKIADALHN
jgi:hypothetical protein